MARRNLPWSGRSAAEKAAAFIPNVVTAAIVLIIAFGVCVLIGGIVIALMASRNAPDGFEDQEGFHVGRLPSARRK